MARTSTKPAEPEAPVTGEVVGNDEDLIADIAREREERGLTAGLTARPQRQLILSNDDRMTMYGLITANLGSGGATGVTAAEFDYFIRVCELRGINPLFREAHFIKDGDGRITVQIGIDGFRKLAEDTGEYRGQTAAEWGPLYDGEQPEWVGKPGYVRVGVVRAGFDAPLFGEAWIEEDGQAGRDGKAIGQWAKRPRTMLRKVAEARALRAAFPRQMSGLYSEEEIPDPKLVGSGEGRTLGELPPGTAPAPPGATEPAGTVVEGTWRPADPPPAPEGLQGPLEIDADGVRVVVPTSEVSAKYNRKGVRGEKLELVFKVRNRKHTAILWEPLSVAADAAGLKAGELVSVKGTVEEIVWQEGKPTKKEVWGVTAVSVLRDNVWTEIGSNAPTLPLDTANEPAVVETPPAPATTPAPNDAAGAPASNGSMPEPSGPPADLTPPAAPPPAPPPDLSPPSTAATAPRQPLPAAPTIESKVDNEIAGPFALRLVTDITFGQAAGRAYGSFGAVHGSGETIKCVVGDEPPGELAANLGSKEDPTYREGNDVRAVGFWRNNWLVVSAIGIEPL